MEAETVYHYKHKNVHTLLSVEKHSRRGNGPVIGHPHLWVANGHESFNHHLIGQFVILRASVYCKGILKTNIYMCVH